MSLMNLSRREAESWIRYGLSIGVQLWEYEPDHAMAVARAHSKVAQYLDEHPDAQGPYLQQRPGFRYYDIADIAVGKEAMDALSKEARAVNECMRSRFRQSPKGEPDWSRI